MLRGGEVSEKKYRPFKNAEEAKQHCYGWFLQKSDDTKCHVCITAFSDRGVWLAGASVALSYEEAFERLLPLSGTPFGVEVEEQWRPAVASDVKNPPVKARYRDSEADEWKYGQLIWVNVSSEPHLFPYLVRFGCNNAREWFHLCEVRA